MGFGYKTCWLAVRGRSVKEVADALQLTDRTSMRFAAGTQRAYEGKGSYVTPEIAGWTLVHGANDPWQPLDVGDPRFPAHLAALSGLLGEVQFFKTHRVSEYHAWALARDGHLIRAYCYIGDSGTVPLFIGEPTAAERIAGVGTRDGEDDRENWTDDDWKTWLATTPDESDVMRIARQWSIAPDDIDDDTVTGKGLHGLPTFP